MLLNNNKKKLCKIKGKYILSKQCSFTHGLKNHMSIFGIYYLQKNTTTNYLSEVNKSFQGNISAHYVVAPVK